jgi:hypothetical protein
MKNALFVSGFNTLAPWSGSESTKNFVSGGIKPVYNPFLTE